MPSNIHVRAACKGGFPPCCAGGLFHLRRFTYVGETIKNVSAAAFLIDSGDPVCSLDDGVIVVERGDPSAMTVLAFTGPCWAQPWASMSSLNGYFVLSPWPVLDHRAIVTRVTVNPQDAATQVEQNDAGKKIESTDTKKWSDAIQRYNITEAYFTFRRDQ